MNKLLPKELPVIDNFMEFVLRGCSMWGVGIFADPVLELDAVPKPLNVTQRVDWVLNKPPLYNNALIKIPAMRWQYIRNRLGIYVDDTKLEVTPKMCEAIERVMEPMKEGGRLQHAVKDGLQRGTRIRRLVLKVLTDLPIVKTLVNKVFKPKIATYYNADSFTGNGNKCSTNMLASYYHYYGGNTKVVDDSYQVKGTQDLYIADQSVLPLLKVAPTTTASMQTGMRVADAFVASLDSEGTDQ